MKILLNAGLDAIELSWVQFDSAFLYPSKKQLEKSDADS